MELGRRIRTGRFQARAHARDRRVRKRPARGSVADLGRKIRDQRAIESDSIL